MLKSILNFLASKTIKILDWPQIQGLEIADPNYIKSNKIEMYTQIIQEGIKRHGLIIAHASTLGWILSGVGLTDPQDISLLHCSVDEKISYTKPINI